MEDDRYWISLMFPLSRQEHSLVCFMRIKLFYLIKIASTFNSEPGFLNPRSLSLIQMVRCFSYTSTVFKMVLNWSSMPKINSDHLFFPSPFLLLFFLSSTKHSGLLLFICFSIFPITFYFVIISISMSSPLIQSKL